MSHAARDQSTERDAHVYHRVSAPQVSCGQRVLARLTLEGRETVLGAGCGTGRLTAELLERLPRRHVIAVDRSANMLTQAAGFLPPRFGDRVTFSRADIQDIVIAEPVDVIEREDVRSAFMTDFTEMASTDDPPLLLDNWRLNLSARRPLAT